MNRLRPLIVVLCACGIFSWLAWYDWNQSANPAAVPQTDASHVNSSSAAEVVVVTSNTAVKQNSHPPEEPHPNEIAIAYEAARDWRVLFESLLQRKDNGAGLYAVTILMRCSGMIDIARTITPPASTQAQESARQLFVSRCASFAGDEASMERAMQLMRDSRLKNDPYLALMNGWKSQPGDVEAERQSVARYLETGDPLLLEHMAGRLFPLAEGAAVKFDGTTYMQPHASDVFQKAWRSAICEATGGACGSRGDPYVNETCAITGQCFDSRRQAMRAALDSAYGPAAVQLFDKVHPRLVDVIRRKGNDAFF